MTESFVFQFYLLASGSKNGLQCMRDVTTFKSCQLPRLMILSHIFDLSAYNR
jgi:hypothetical protein